MNVVMFVLNPMTNDARVERAAATLAQNGYRVTVIALHKNGLPVREQRQGYTIERVQLRSDDWRNNGITQLIRYFEFSVRAALIAKRTQPQVCHAHAIQALPAGWLTAKRCRIPLIYDAHEYEAGLQFGEHSQRIPKFIQQTWTLPENLFIRTAHTVITVSPSLANALKQRYAIPAPQVILNVTEQPATASAATSNRLRQQFNLPPELPIVLYQGGLTPGRGLPQFVQAAAHLPQAAFILVGDGLLLSSLQQQAQQLPPKSQVYFTGRVPLAELPEITRCANLGVVLTQNTCLNHYYSLPNKIFEYLHAGIPIIGSNLPEIAHIITQWQVGKVVNPEDPLAIAAGIRALLENPQDYQNAQSHTQQAAAAYNWQTESQKLLHLYQSLRP